MKNLKIVLAILVMVSFTSLANAQNGNNKTTVVKTNRKTIENNKKVSQKRVVYKTPTKKKVVVQTLPKGKSVGTYKGIQYHYANNRYYSHNNGNYIPVRPALGLRIKVLPTNYVRIAQLNHIYYFHSGIYYSQQSDEYEVVNPELGTIVYELPDDSEEVNIDGLTYLEFNNILYERVQVDGTRAYEVVGFLDY